jgi:hypothetical protein
MKDYTQDFGTVFFLWGSGSNIWIRILGQNDALPVPGTGTVLKYVKSPLAIVSQLKEKNFF